MAGLVGTRLSFQCFAGEMRCASQLQRISPSPLKLVFWIAFMLPLVPVIRDNAACAGPKTAGIPSCHTPVGARGIDSA